MPLSPQQAAVVDFVRHGRGSLQLIARAGCGKTFTILESIKAIVEDRLGEATILAYNKAIADEIKAKLGKLSIDWRTANAMTVHGAGFGAWKKVVGSTAESRDFIDGDKVYHIIDDNAGIQTPQNAREPNISRDCRSAIAKLVSLAKQNAVGVLYPLDDGEVWSDIYDHFGLDEEHDESYSKWSIIQCAQFVYEQSLNLCRQVIDYDDMILAPLYYRAKFWGKDFIFVDEAQDTNPARRLLALRMLKRTGRMIFVGDDRQAIYGFTGADATAMTQLAEQTNATTLPLNVTYRCPKRVVQLAQAIVPDFTAHPDAPLGEVQTMLYDDLATIKFEPTDAILCRNTAPLITTAYALIGANVACKVEGRDIGVGLIKLAKRWKVKLLSALTNKLTDYEERETKKHVAAKTEHKLARIVDQIECLRVMIAKCQRENKQTVDDLCAAIDGLFGDTADGRQPVLTLATIHKSKGREWDRVFILGRRKFLPSKYARKDWQMVQEENLEYVAITRAQRVLVDLVMVEG